MQKFVMTLEFQQDFLEAFQNSTMEQWYKKNKELLIRISEDLKRVKIPKCGKKMEELCELICDSFLPLLKSLWDSTVLGLKTKSRIKKFKTRLLELNQTKNWTPFQSKYMYYFDSVLGFMREQGIVDIRVQGLDKVRQLSFFEAIQCEPIHQRHKNQRQVSTSYSNPTPVSYSNPAPVSSNQKERKAKTNDRKAEKEYKKQLEEIRKGPDPEVQFRSDTDRKGKKGPEKVKRAESQTSLSSNFSLARKEADIAFRKSLDAQNQAFAEELRIKREKREQMNREAEEDMRQFRKESALRIQMFLNCIKLRIRWEEQEQEWGDWLKAVRSPVVKVKTTFLNFDHNRKFNDKEDNKTELLYLQKCVQTAYDKLIHEFDKLTLLSDRYDNKLFLKIIQSSISKMATKLCILMDALDGFENTDSFFNKLSTLERKIDSMDIPTTSKIRLICETAKPEDYKIVEKPRAPKSHCVITEIY
ncbi:hypothetical protein GCK72_016847 [Caenorhabditis remanei]|uniref:Uncharacterized protein n=1 Tax=Caenorhabditis remanei TaxID=31234 RepID=A0A6A5G741_CAERE|nr:hypothetical protein GCK72_016847 [Caenorhabditis remanei]KAF1750299.1 hypothetical protein GCK72_016847 [Caenorhabditis remanei]